MSALAAASLAAALLFAPVTVDEPQCGVGWSEECETPASVEPTAEPTAEPIPEPTPTFTVSPPPKPPKDQHPVIPDPAPTVLPNGPADVPSVPQLAETGTDLAGWILGAALLLAAGGIGASLDITRRRGSA